MRIRIRKMEKQRRERRRERRRRRRRWRKDDEKRDRWIQIKIDGGISGIFCVSDLAAY